MQWSGCIPLEMRGIKKMAFFPSNKNRQGCLSGLPSLRTNCRRTLASLSKPASTYTPLGFSFGACADVLTAPSRLQRLR